MKLVDEKMKERIRSNIFRDAHTAVEPWETFPWHRGSDGKIDAYKKHSSQALAIDVFGTLKMSSDRDTILNHLAKELDLPIEGTWEIDLEWKDPKNLLKERRQTQVDVVACNRKSLIFFECKFTEADGGSCSQPEPIKDGQNKGLKQCNGSYEKQTNPVNKKIARCALTGKGIRYWDVIPQIFDYVADIDYKTCPFKGPRYQWMRNLTACWEVAKDKHLVPAFIVVFADTPKLPLAEKVKSEEWKEFVSHILPRRIGVRTVSFQKIVKMSCNEAVLEPNTYHDLLHWVEYKIEQVAHALTS
jgi:hypothetical protein